MTNIEDVKKDLSKVLSKKRYKHSIAVMEKAIELASIYNIDIEKAALAAVAHDIAKEMDKKDALFYINDNNIKVDELERKQPSLLHGPIGADICKNQYGFSEDMTRAIAIHTTGDINMSVLDKIVFLSDKIEKNRKYDSVEEIRDVSKSNLDKAILLFLDHHIANMIKKERIIHPKSILLRNELLSKLNEE